MTIFVLTNGLVLMCVLSVLAARNLSRFWLLSPPVLMVVYFLMVVLPGIYLSSNRIAVEAALFAHLVWFFGVSIAVTLSGAVKGHRKIQSSTRLAGNKKIMIFFVLLSVPAVAFTFYMLGRVPLFIGISSLLGADSDLSMHAARRMNTLQHRSGDTVYFGQGYLRQIYTVVSPVFLVALYFFNRSRNPERALPLISVMMTFLVVAAMLNGQIWIAAHVMILFIMAKCFSIIAAQKNSINVSIVWKGIVAYCALVGFVFAYRYLQYIEGRLFDDFVLNALGRIYSPGAIDLFIMFPESESFRYGATWINDLSGMLPGSVQSFAYEVHFLVHGGGWGFTLSPGVVASSYVNFGYAGVFAVGMLSTIVFMFIYMRLSNSGSAIKLAIAMYLSHRFMLAMPGDLSSYVISIVTAVLMYAAYVTLNTAVKLVSRRRTLVSVPSA